MINDQIMISIFEFQLFSNQSILIDNYSYVMNFLYFCSVCPTNKNKIQIGINYIIFINKKE